MIDYKFLDALFLIEQMTGKPAYYLVDAVKTGKLGELSLKFDVTVDENKVPVKVQHFVELSWNA